MRSGGAGFSWFVLTCMSKVSRLSQERRKPDSYSIEIYQVRQTRKNFMSFEAVSCAMCESRQIQELPWDFEYMCRRALGASIEAGNISFIFVLDRAPTNVLLCIVQP